MKTKYLEVFEKFNECLLNSPNQRKTYNYLQIIFTKQIKKIEYSDKYEPEKLTRKMIFAQYSKKPLDKTDGKLASKRVDIKKLEETIIKLINSNEDYRKSFLKIGYIPRICSSETKGGSGNQLILWLDIEEFKIQDEELTEPSVSIQSIEYDRTNSKDIKISLFAKLFFNDNELKMKSARGISIMIIFLIIFFGLIALSILLLIVYFYLENTKNSLWSLFSLFGMPIVIFWFFTDTLIPLYKLLIHRVIKVPHFVFLNINEDDADLELCRGDDKLSVARITRFTSTCPICSAPIELRKGKPDQKYPLVGRCKEAPHAHVYSFDRMEMKGYFLGHEGYLKDNDC